MDIANTAPPPQWVSTEASLINGLDLLGLRIPVEWIGAELLSGITTISPTARYVSLRAWIAWKYANSRLPDSWNAFREYAGRIEAAVAIGNLLNDTHTGGLVGWQGANEIIRTKDDPLRLDAMVKQLAVAAYTGPSDQLGISFQTDSGVPGLTKERGVPLAQSVEEVLSLTSFSHSITKRPEAAVFKRQELRELGATFPIGKPTGKERMLLVESVVPSVPRQGEIGRVATYGLLLELASKSPQGERECGKSKMRCAHPLSYPSASRLRASGRVAKPFGAARKLQLPAPAECRK